MTLPLPPRCHCGMARATTPRVAVGRPTSGGPLTSSSCLRCRRGYSTGPGLRRRSQASGSLERPARGCSGSLGLRGASTPAAGPFTRPLQLHVTHHARGTTQVISPECGQFSRGRSGELRRREKWTGPTDRAGGGGASAVRLRRSWRAVRQERSVERAGGTSRGAVGTRAAATARRVAAPAPRGAHARQRQGSFTCPLHSST
jgi:hypothetical protein